MHDNLGGRIGPLSSSMPETPDENARPEARIIVLSHGAKPVAEIVAMLGDRARRVLWVDPTLGRSSERPTEPLRDIAIRRIIVADAPAPWTDLAPLFATGLLPERVERADAGHAYTRAATWDTLGN
jgi:hypothetical protein